jgi:hypothetical protein
MIALQGPFQDGLPIKTQAALHIEMRQFAGVSPSRDLLFGNA